MCDFHSVVIRFDGVIAHVNKNSHSAAVAAAGWKENSDSRLVFWEAEWDGQGDWPGVKRIVQKRNGKEPPTEVLKSAERHYRALQRAIQNGELAAIFYAPEYSDVRCFVARNVKCP